MHYCFSQAVPILENITNYNIALDLTSESFITNGANFSVSNLNFFTSAIFVRSRPMEEQSRQQKEKVIHFKTEHKLINRWSKKAQRRNLSPLSGPILGIAALVFHADAFIGRRLQVIFWLYRKRNYKKIRSMLLTGLALFFSFALVLLPLIVFLPVLSISILVLSLLLYLSYQ
jgi:hypothetical protein